MKIRCTDEADDRDWLQLRGEFFPEDFPGEHQKFLQNLSQGEGGRGRFTAFVAHADDGVAMGFAEVAIRQDYVNGCQHRPALFLEGIFVRPEFRGQGIAHALCAAAEEFGLRQGCHEFASDVFIDDQASLAAHVALGFAETERVVFFRKIMIAAKDRQE